MAAPPVALAEPTKWRRTSVATGNLVIDPQIGHVNRLLDVFVSGMATSNYLDVFIGTTWKLRLYNWLLDSVLVDTPVETPQQCGFLSWMRKLIQEWPVLYACHDEKITIKPSASYTRLTAYYLREPVAAPADKTQPGGSQARVEGQCFWMTHMGSLAADALDVRFDKKLMPPEMYELVDGSQVKQERQLDLHGLIFGNESDSSDSHVDRIKLLDERVILFTPETQDGLEVDPDAGNELQCDVLHERFFKLHEPYIMGKGHRYGFRFDFDHITTTRAANRYVLGLVGIWRALG